LVPKMFGWEGRGGGDITPTSWLSRTGGDIPRAVCLVTIKKSPKKFSAITAKKNFLAKVILSNAHSSTEKFSSPPPFFEILDTWTLGGEVEYHSHHRAPPCTCLEYTPQPLATGTWIQRTRSQFSRKWTYLIDAVCLGTTKRSAAARHR
jgi:hypothetical protein